MSYLVLARKYRSETFDEVVGQEPVAQTLVSAIKRERIAHAYLFTGTRGVGKTTMARIFAKALNCLSFDAPTTTPCNKCEVCKSISRGDDVDVIEIDGASNNGVDEIRELRSNAIFRPARSRFKIYYIDEVHMLSKGAFNALLKTLEEPPSHVKFIFSTTEIEKIPATIVSRCQRFDFRNIPTRQIAEHLKNLCDKEQIEAQGEALFRIARAARGSMRDGLSLLEQLLSGAKSVSEEDVVRILGTPSDELTVKMVWAIAQKDTPAALGELACVLKGGITLDSVVSAMADVFRNIMLARTCGADSDLIELTDTQRQQIAGLSKEFSVPFIVQAVGVLNAASRNIHGSSVARALVEASIIRLAEAEKFIDPQSLIKVIESMPAGGGSPPAQKKKLTPPPVEHPRITEHPGTVTQKPQTQAETAAPRENRQAEKAIEKIIMDAGWLRSNWNDVVTAVYAINPQVAGAVRPAVVKSATPDTIILEYGAAHEQMRQRAEKTLTEQVNRAFSQLAGPSVKVELLKGEDVDDSNTPRLFGNISTAERIELNNDPSVTAVTGLFGGTVDFEVSRADLSKTSPCEQTDENDDEE